MKCKNLDAGGLGRRLLDVGDNVKFSLPMDFTTTVLSWNVIEFGRFIGDELQNSKSSIRWTIDYFLNASAYTGTL